MCVGFYTRAQNSKTRLVRKYEPTVKCIFSFSTGRRRLLRDLKNKNAITESNDECMCTFNNFYEHSRAVHRKSAKTFRLPRWRLRSRIHHIQLLTNHNRAYVCTYIYTPIYYVLLFTKPSRCKMYTVSPARGKGARPPCNFVSRTKTRPVCRTHENSLKTETVYDNIT